MCSYHVTYAFQSQSTLTVKKSSDKRSIMVTFAITFSGKFSSMQLIYGEKTRKSLPRTKFPTSFSLSYNESHYSNERESCTLTEKISVPSDLPLDQRALVILDFFSRQVTTTVLDCFKYNKIEVVCVPANLTHQLQPLGITVNGYAKKFTSRSEWWY